MRGAQLSAGYTVNTYSKPPLYDASKGNDVCFSQRANFLLLKTSADRHASDIRLTNRTASQSDSTQLKAGNFDDTFSRFDTIHACDRRTDRRNWRGIYAL